MAPKGIADEIGLSQQRLVSEALLCFQGYKVGKFYLTCREYYDVINLNVPEVRIGGFSLEEKHKFVTAFLKAFESGLDAKKVVNELEERGFGDFLTHPLLLALACIVKTSTDRVQPRSALRLLQRTIEVLSERWDASKGLVRATATSLDGRDRIQMLKRLAYVASSSSLPKNRAEVEAQKQIDLLNIDKVDARKALLETAKFYGILVAYRRWMGVCASHRTRLSRCVLLGRDRGICFGQEESVDGTNRRCGLSHPGCTQDFEAALQAPDGLPAVAEMLSNAAPMDAKKVANRFAPIFQNRDVRQL